MKKVYRSKNDRIVAGVIGGFGEYLDIDPTALRVLWVIILVFTAVIPGVIAYLIAAILMPMEQTGMENESRHMSDLQQQQNREANSDTIHL